MVALRKNESCRLPAAGRTRKDSRSRLRVVEGGEHRQHSVANALAPLQAADDDIVLVHDAVRPFVNDETIDGVIAA